MVLSKIDSRGRIGIPKQIREELGLDPGQVVDITIEGKRLIIRKVREVIFENDCEGG